MTHRNFSRSAGTLVLLSWLMISTGAAAQSDVGGAGALDCTIEPRTIAKIGSADDGIIETIPVKRGDIVSKGQVLAVLDSRIEKLAVDLARVQAEQDVEIRSRRARLDYQRNEAERAGKLFEKRIVSNKALDEAVVQEQIAELDLESAAVRRKVTRAELLLAEERLNRRTIRSPINAIVTEVSKAPGEYIHEQTPLLTLAQIDELNVEVFVPVPRYGQIVLGQKAVVEPVQPIGGRYEATVQVVDRVFDAASGTFGVRLHLPNPEGTLPAGIRCKVTFPESLATRRP